MVWHETSMSVDLPCVETSFLQVIMFMVICMIIQVMWPIDVLQVVEVDTTRKI